MSANKKNIILTCLTSISGLSILYVIYAFFRNFTLDSFYNSVYYAFLYSGWEWLFGLILLSLYIRGRRWARIFCSSIQEKTIVSTLFHGWFSVLSMLSIFRVGETFRIDWLRERGMQPAQALGYIFVEKLSDAFILAIIFFSCIFKASDALTGVSLLISIFIFILYISFSLFGNHLYKKIHSANPEISSRKLSYLFSFFKKNLLSCLILRNIKLNIEVMVFSIAIWCTVIIAFHIFITQQFPNIPFYASALIVAMVNLTGALNLTPANIGPFEISVTVVLVLFDINEENAAIFAITLHFIVIMMTITYGLFCRLLIASYIIKYKGDRDKT